MENIITLKDKIYPDLLKKIYSPPQKLFYQGDFSVLEKTCISVVGTRRNSEYGQYLVEKIVEELAVLDIVIVSGLAKGIDTLAHQAALNNGLKTIAVLGSGLNQIYPSSNHNLATKIAANGLLVSEYEPDQQPLKYQFPQRNRIISGISVATIIIEAPEKSGALITAYLALEQGREVFVVPGDVDRLSSMGNLRLLQNSSAYLITSGQDIIEVLKEQPHLFASPKSAPKSVKPTLPYNLTVQEKNILQFLSPVRGTTAEILSQKASMSIPDTLTTLSLLEIQGLIKVKEDAYLRRY